MSDQPAPPGEHDEQRPMKSKGHERSEWMREYIRSGEVRPFSAEEEAEFRAGLDKVILPPSDRERRLFATLDAERTLRQDAEHARQQALSLNEQRAETITAYARELLGLRMALAEERQAREHIQAQYDERLQISRTLYGENVRLKDYISEQDDNYKELDRAFEAEAQARERAEAGWAEANQRLKDGPDHPPHCDHQMGCHVQETAWMREAADARAALAACEAQLAEARENLSVAVEMLGEFVGDRCFRLCDGDGTSRRHTERCQADRYNLEQIEQAQPAARTEEGTR